MAKAKTSTKTITGVPKTAAPTSTEIMQRLEALEKKSQEDSSYISRLQAQLEKQTVEKELKPTEGLEIVGPMSFTPQDPMEALSRPHVDNDKGSVFRWVNKHETIKPLRHFQGYETVKDTEGNVVRYMDMELAKMPKERHKDMVVKPRDQKRRHHLDAIGASRRASQAMEQAIKANNLDNYVSGEVKLTYDRKDSLNE